jgi:hypothetical protein
MRSGIDVLAMRFGLLSSNLRPVNLQGAASRALHETHRFGEDVVLQDSDSPLLGCLVPQQSEH